VLGKEKTNKGDIYCFSLDILTLSEVINSNLISSNIGNLTGSENTKLRYVALGIEVDTPQ
jgi:hypothetical protein